MTPPTEAVRSTGPATVPAVRVAEVAMPSTFVDSVSVDPPEKLADPEATVKVTVAPSTGLP